MRSDMHKVVIERPRAGISRAHCAARKRRRKNNDKRHWDEAPSKQAMGRWSYGEGKEFTDFLEPLYGLLWKRVGTRWDDVYSEIREHLNPSKTTHAHIFQHLDGAVELNAVLDEDGFPWAIKRYGERHYEPLVAYNYGRRGYANLYVHPVTGILTVAPEAEKHPGWVAQRKEREANYAAQREKAAKKEAPETITKQIKGRVYQQVNGTWFEVVLVPLPKGYDWGKPIKRFRKDVTRDLLGNTIVKEVPFEDAGPLDVVLGIHIGYVERRSQIEYTGPGILRNRYQSRLVEVPGVARSKAHKTYGRTDVYAPGTRRQLNTKELRNLGLVNGPRKVWDTQKKEYKTVP